MKRKAFTSLMEASTRILLGETHMIGKTVIVKGKKGRVIEQVGSDGKTELDEIYKVKFEDGTVKDIPARDMEMQGDISNKKEPSENEAEDIVNEAKKTNAHSGIPGMSRKGKKILSHMANSFETTGGPHLDHDNVHNLTHHGVNQTIKKAHKHLEDNPHPEALKQLALIKKELGESFELDEREVRHNKSRKPSGRRYKTGDNPYVDRELRRLLGTEKPKSKPKRNSNYHPGLDPDLKLESVELDEAAPKKPITSSQVRLALQGEPDLKIKKRLSMKQRLERPRQHVPGETTLVVRDGKVIAIDKGTERHKDVLASSVQYVGNDLQEVEMDEAIRIENGVKKQDMDPSMRSEWPFHGMSKKKWDEIKAKAKQAPEKKKKARKTRPLTNPMYTSESTELNESVFEYFENYFGDNLNENTSDEDIMDAVHNLVYLTEAVCESVNLYESHASRELHLFTVNHEDIHRRRLNSIHKNLRNKMAKGVYDSGKAHKAFMYAAKDGSDAYHKDHGHRFSKEDRQNAATAMRNDFETEAEAGNHDHHLYKKYQKKK